MTQYALVLDGATVRYHEFGDETPPELSANKGVWLPVVDEAEGEPGPGETTFIDTIVEGTQVRRVTTVVAKPIETLKAEKREAINTAFAAEFQAGFTPDTGPLAGHTLQVRNLEDRTNWLTSKGEYQSAIEAGYGALVGATFRSQDNVTVTVSFADGLAALRAMAAWGQTKYARLWALKDALDAAVTAEDVAAIDETTGW